MAHEVSLAFFFLTALDLENFCEGMKNMFSIQLWS